MAGKDRPRCVTCGKLYKFDWETESFYRNCGCPLEEGKEIDDDFPYGAC